MKDLNKITSKRFKVLVCGEIERTTNFLGMMRLLANYSDFFDYTHQRQRAIVRENIKSKEWYIDANITCVEMK